MDHFGRFGSQVHSHQKFLEAPLRMKVEIKPWSQPSPERNSCFYINLHYDKKNFKNLINAYFS